MLRNGGQNPLVRYSFAMIAAKATKEKTARTGTKRSASRLRGALSSTIFSGSGKRRASRTAAALASSSSSSAALSRTGPARGARRDA